MPVTIRLPRLVRTLVLAALFAAAPAAAQQDTWIPSQELLPPPPAGGAAFGSALALWGDTLAVGAPGEDGLATDTGAVHVYERTPQGWSFAQKLVASDGLANDFFGEAIALEGDLLVVGVGERNEQGMANSGAAYVFARVGGIWQEQAKLTADVVFINDFFGESVALQGSTIVVGAYQDDDDSFSSGSAFVFERLGTGWAQVQKLTIGKPAAVSFYGRSLAIEGDRLLVGANRYGNDQGVPVTGAVFAYIARTVSMGRTSSCSPTHARP